MSTETRIKIEKCYGLSLGRANQKWQYCSASIWLQAFQVKKDCIFSQASITKYDSWAWGFGGDGGSRPVAILTFSLNKLLHLKLSIYFSFSPTTEKIYHVTSPNIFINHHIWNHCMWTQSQTESFSIMPPYLSTWSKPAKWEGEIETALYLVSGPLD